MKKLIFLLAITALISCKKETTEDPVIETCDIVCLNNGVQTTNCGCLCESGYYGENCQNQLPSVTMKVTKIVLTNFPQTNNGSNWDNLDGPDIYVAGNVGTTSVNTDEISNYFEDCDNGTDYTYNSLNWVFSSDSNVTISIWDFDDFDSDDPMGGVYFLPLDYDDGFPSTIDLTANGKSFTIYVEWTF